MSRIILGVLVWAMGMVVFLAALLNISPGWPLLGIMFGSVTVMVGGSHLVGYGLQLRAGRRR